MSCERKGERISLRRPVRGGRVYLVGAGPGDPGLLTLRGRDLIEAADVVLADRLVGDEILALVPPEKRVDMGRTPAQGRSTREHQEEINRRLIALAREGKVVVRLKGGDPYVFGRGGEEVEALRAAGIPVEVVPGVTSAVAGPAAFGIPLTHRDRASVAALISGHEGVGKEAPEVDWEALAGLHGTLVVLMGVGSLEDYVSRLLGGGMEPETPVAVIERATLPDQRMVRGPLGEIVDRSRAAGVRPPAVIVIGSVVDLAWEEEGEA